MEKIIKLRNLFKDLKAEYSGYGDIEDDDGNVLCEVFSKNYEIKIGKVAKDAEEKEKFRMKGISMREENFVFLEGEEYDDKMTQTEKKEYYDECEESERSESQGDFPDEGTEDYERACDERADSDSDSEDEW